MCVEGGLAHAHAYAHAASGVVAHTRTHMHAQPCAHQHKAVAHDDHFIQLDDLGDEGLQRLQVAQLALRNDGGPDVVVVHLWPEGGRGGLRNGITFLLRRVILMSTDYRYEVKPLWRRHLIVSPFRIARDSGFLQCGSGARRVGVLLLSAAYKAGAHSFHMLVDDPGLQAEHRPPSNSDWAGGPCT